MKNITYLIGAGASRHALPLVKDFPARMEQFLRIFENHSYLLSTSEQFEKVGTNISKRDLQNQFIDDLKWLKNACVGHASIDTFAKKLFIKKKYKELKKLKIALSAYLVCEQALNKVDGRYDSFFASILNGNATDLPNHLRVISWNYDYQLEKAYAEYTEYSDISDNQSVLNVTSKLTRRKNNNDRFTVYKVNGTVGFGQNSGIFDYHFHDKAHAELDLPMINQVIRNYAALHNIPDTYSTLSFAWESEFDNESIVNKCVSGTKDTQILIVIGYSFPFFNKDIDREVINSMTKLEKVYFQSPDADSIKERFLSIRTNIKDEQLVTRFDTEQFLIPNEF
jgi:hypothetical protein